MRGWELVRESKTDSVFPIIWREQARGSAWGIIPPLAPPRARFSQACTVFSMRLGTRLALYSPSTPSSMVKWRTHKMIVRDVSKIATNAVRKIQ